MRYYIIAGEASGDLHASNLMKELKVEDPDAHFRCWGGDLMQQQGGELVKHYRNLAFMGFLEVIEHLPEILKNFRFCGRDLLRYKPDVLLLVDYPGFNLRMAKFASQHRIRVFYYISPQFWAWRSSRVRKVKKWVNKMFVILPFEKDFYNLHHYSVDFIGHPLLDVINERSDAVPRSQFLASNQLDERPIIALLPGSRRMEIKKMLREMLKVQNYFPDYQFVIAAAPAEPITFYQELIRGTGARIICHQTYDLLRYSRAALVTSGTATLETALMRVPQIVCYKGNYFSYLIARQLIHVNYISLVNLIAGRPLVVELIQKEMNTVRLAEELKNILNEGTIRQSMIMGYDDLKTKLGGVGASSRAAKLIRKYLLLPVLLLLFSLTGLSQQTRQKELIDSGIMKAKLSDYKAALADFNEAILIDSTEAEPWYNRGVVKSELMDYQGALSDFTRVIRIRPAYPEPYYNRGLAKDYLKDYRGAIQDYSKAIALKADFPEAFHNRGLAWFDLGNYQESIDDFTRALQYKPLFPEAYYNRGLSRFNNDDFSGAVQDFNEAIRLDSSQYEYYSSRGAAKAASLSYDEAVTDFKISLSINPDDTDTEKNLALAYLYLKQFKEAEALYTRILQNNPDEPEILANRGVARNNLGNKPGACEDWKLASQLGSEKSKSYLLKFCE